jgi:predicted lactoylglutathione lyase
MSRQIYVNLAVNDLNKSVEFSPSWGSSSTPTSLTTTPPA